MHRALAAQAVELLDPQTYAEAVQASDAAQWKLAMDEEMTSLQDNGLWTWERRVLGVKPIPAKGVLKVKQDALGNISSNSDTRPD